MSAWDEPFPNEARGKQQPSGFRSTILRADVAASTLAVFVHGWGQTAESLSTVRDIVRLTLPDANCASIEHDGRAIFCSTRPEVIADRIAYEIDCIAGAAAAAGRPYARIILIGHSVGALLLKKAYAYASGCLEDSVAGQTYGWPPLVDRIISLAGIDRGLPFVQKTENMPVGSFLLRRVLYTITRLLRTATFIRALQRGDPFVANLRIAWLRLATFTTDAPCIDVPTVFHLVGDRDNVVERGDSVDDLLRSSRYQYRTVTGADHRSIVRPDRNPYVQRELVAALTADVAPRRTREEATVETETRTEKMTDIFYVIHGIRDLGRTWTPGICDAIRTATQADRAKTIRTVRTSYGYFSMLQFLLAPDRQKNVRWFMDLFTQMVARYPKARHHYVGHSNGTYILASALARYATCRVCNVVFAGSVVPSAFDWTKYQQRGQVAYVRNDAGSADWVIALFPHLFELLASLFSWVDLNAPKWLDLGAAGFYGFYDDLSNDNTWLPGQHGAAIVPTNFASIAHTVVYGRWCAPDPVVVRQNVAVATLSKFAWLVVTLGFAIVGLAVVLLFNAPVPFWHHLPWLARGAVLAGLLFLMSFTI